MQKSIKHHSNLIVLRYRESYTLQMSKVKNSVVIVTGASAGIGVAIVRELAKRGANVMLTARRAERLEAVVDSLAALPGRRVALAGDVRDEAFCQQLVKETVATFGRIDTLINNAGLGHRSHLSEIPREHMATIADTNIIAPMQLSQAVIPHMRSQRKGHIINVSSIVSQRPLANSGFYCASKAAVNALTRAQRMELRRDRIVVSALYPGLTDTDFHEAVLGGREKRQFWSGVSAERVGRVTVRAIKRRKTEIYVTWFDWLFTHGNRLLPRTSDRIMAVLWRG